MADISMKPALPKIQASRLFSKLQPFRPSIFRGSIAWAAKKKTDTDAATTAEIPKKRASRKKKETIELNEDVPAPAPLTFVSAITPEGEDTASSILSQSIQRRKRGPAGVSRAGEAAEHGEHALDQAEEPRADEDAEAEGSLVVSDEVIEVLNRIEPDPDEVIRLPPEFRPRHWTEEVYAEALESQHYWETRRTQAKVIEDAAWQAHHFQNRDSVNRYAMTRRVARIMAEVEHHDFMRGERAPQHIPPWARAELIFADEYEEFNAYVAENIDRITKRPPKEAEEDALDILDDALFLLSREDDDNALNRKVEKRTEDYLLSERYLDNILPGVSLSSLSEAYADDIFAAEDDELLAVDDALISLPDMGGSKAKKAAASRGKVSAGDDSVPKKRGRPSKKSTSATESVEEE